jgi:hypothetical protein
MQKTFFKLVFCWHLEGSMMKLEGSGSGSKSGSISQSHRSADPHQNVMHPQHCLKLILEPYSSLFTSSE